MLATNLEIARHLTHVKRNGLADHIGGFYEWVSLIGYSRQHADRLVSFYERITGSSRV